MSAQEFTQEVLAKGQSAEAFFSQPFVSTIPEPDLRPRAHGGFSSPSGRFEFYSERMARDGLDPLPAFLPPFETLGNGPYPLNFLSRKHKDSLNSSYGHLPVMRDQEDKIRVLEMHPHDADADARGLHDRDELRVFNARGEFRIRLQISTNVPPGTVATFWGWWDKLSGGRGVVNNVTSPAISVRGGGGNLLRLPCGSGALDRRGALARSRRSALRDDPFHHQLRDLLVRVAQPFLQDLGRVLSQIRRVAPDRGGVRLRCAGWFSVLIGPYRRWW